MTIHVDQSSAQPIPYNLSFTHNIYYSSFISFYSRILLCEIDNVVMSYQFASSSSDVVVDESHPSKKSKLIHSSSTSTTHTLTASYSSNTTPLTYTIAITPSLSTIPINVVADSSSSTSFDSSHLHTYSPFPLYDDVLQLIIAYLNVNELHTVIQLSTQWRSVINKMKPMGLTFFYGYQFPFENISEYSSVASHIINIKYLQTLSVPRSIHGEMNKSQKQQLVLSLGKRFPHLRRGFISLWSSYVLGFTLNQTDQSDVTIVLPTTLEEFEAEVSVYFLSQLMKSLGELIHLTSLKLRLPSYEDSYSLTSIDFSSLQPLIHLKTLSLPYQPSPMAFQSIEKIMHSSVIQLIRTLPQLAELRLTSSELYSDELELQHNHDLPIIIHAIAKQPHQLKLTSFEFYGLITLPILEALTQIPTLTELGDLKLDDSDSHLLTHFPHLRRT